MLKKWLVCMLLVMLLTSAACGATTLRSDHKSFAEIVDGHADYSDARFGYVRFRVRNREATDDTAKQSGTLTVSGGNYTYADGDGLKKVAGTSDTFILSPNPSNKEYYLLKNKEDDEIRFGLEADNGLNGASVSWNFPDMPSLNGQGVVSTYKTTQEQMNSYVPYFEYVLDGSKATGIKWRIVNPSDMNTPVSQDFYMGFNINDVVVGSEYLDADSWTDIAPGDTPEGIIMFESPVEASEIVLVVLRLDTSEPGKEGEYQWYFYKKDRDPEPYLYSRYDATASIINGKADYRNAAFRGIGTFPMTDNVTGEAKYFTEEGRLNVPGGGYTLIARDWKTPPTVLDTIEAGRDMTFKLIPDEEMTIGGEWAGYKPVDISGTEIFFGGDEGNTLLGKTISWTFPEALNLNGSAAIPNYKSVSQQLIDGVPYIELVSEDGYITAIDYKIVTADDTSTAIEPSYRTDFSFVVEFGNDSRIDVDRINRTAHGTCTLVTPVAVDELEYINAVFRSYENSDEAMIYIWHFTPASEDINSDDTDNDNCLGNSGFTFSALALVALHLLYRKH